MSGRGLCDEMITRPEETYRLWCVAVCDTETSSMRRQNQSVVTELKKTGDISLDYFLHAITPSQHIMYSDC